MMHESEWLSNQTDQRRIRHLVSISIRNLTLSPQRDFISSSLLHHQPLFSSQDPFSNFINQNGSQTSPTTVGTGTGIGGEDRAITTPSIIDENGQQPPPALTRARTTSSATSASSSSRPRSIYGTLAQQQQQQSHASNNHQVHSRDDTDLLLNLQAIQKKNGGSRRRTGSGVSATSSFLTGGGGGAILGRERQTGSGGVGLRMNGDGRRLPEEDLEEKTEDEDASQGEEEEGGTEEQEQEQVKRDDLNSGSSSSTTRIRSKRKNFDGSKGLNGFHVEGENDNKNDGKSDKGSSTMTQVDGIVKGQETNISTKAGASRKSKSETAPSKPDRKKKGKKERRGPNGVVKGYSLGEEGGEGDDEEERTTDSQTDEGISSSTSSSSSSSSSAEEDDGDPTISEPEPEPLQPPTLRSSRPRKGSSASILLKTQQHFPGDSLPPNITNNNNTDPTSPANKRASVISFSSDIQFAPPQLPPPLDISSTSQARPPLTSTPNPAYSFNPTTATTTSSSTTTSPFPPPPPPLKRRPSSSSIVSVFTKPDGYWDRERDLLETERERERERMGGGGGGGGMDSEIREKGKRRRREESVRRRLVESLLVLSVPSEEKKEEEETSSSSDGDNNNNNNTGKKKVGDGFSNHSTTTTGWKPFYVSEIHPPSMDPDFGIDLYPSGAGLGVGSTISSPSSSAFKNHHHSLSSSPHFQSKRQRRSFHKEGEDGYDNDRGALSENADLDEEDDLMRLVERQSKVCVAVWVRRALVVKNGNRKASGKGREIVRKSDNRTGSKGKDGIKGQGGGDNAADADVEGTEETEREPWILLLEWELDLMSGLRSLGRDPSNFPSLLPPNSLILHLSGEYFTIPPPPPKSLQNQRRHPRSRSKIPPTSSSRRGTAPPGHRRTVSSNTAESTSPPPIVSRFRQSVPAISSSPPAADRHLLQLELDGNSNDLFDDYYSSDIDPGNLSDPGTISKGAARGRAIWSGYTYNNPSRSAEGFRMGFGGEFSRTGEGVGESETSTAAVQRREDREMERKRAMERSKRETRMLYSYGVEDIVKMVSVGIAVKETQNEVGEVKRAVAGLLDEEDGWEVLNREHSEREERNKLLRANIVSRKADLDRRRSAIEARKAVLQTRRERLKRAEQKHKTQKDDLDLAESDYELDEKIHSSIRLSFTQRQIFLLTQLCEIFPIEPSTPPESRSSNKAPTHQNLYSICTASLPNSPFTIASSPPYLTDDSISSALGFAAQLTNILSYYLGVPILYPIKCLGSRSLIWDPISTMRGLRWFPLYSKGVDKYRFDYAVFLLNKDIEQLLYSQHLPVSDLRNTLPNLAALCSSLTRDTTPWSTPLPSRHGSMNVSREDAGIKITTSQQKTHPRSSVLTLPVNSSRNPSISPPSPAATANDHPPPSTLSDSETDTFHSLPSNVLSVAPPNNLSALDPRSGLSARNSSDDNVSRSSGTRSASPASTVRASRVGGGLGRSASVKSRASVKSFKSSKSAKSTRSDQVEGDGESGPAQATGEPDEKVPNGSPALPLVNQSV